MLGLFWFGLINLVRIRLGQVRVSVIVYIFGRSFLNVCLKRPTTLMRRNLHFESVSYFTFLH